MAARRDPLPFGFNVYGYLTSNLGLGVAGRNTVAMLIGAGQDLRLEDVNPGGGMQGRDKTFTDAISKTRDAGPYSVNLFHINPDQIQYLFRPPWSRVRISDTIQVCVPFWELPRLPSCWIPPLEAMDLILAPTKYVQDAIRADLPDANIIHFPQSVRLPDGIDPDRQAFGLPEGATIFVMSFDMRSDLERKNPIGVIDAFERAFPAGRNDVRLVVKINNAGTASGHEPHMLRLRQAAGDPRVLLIDRPLSYREVLSLYASCDALISLHRAEGLGLSMLEAMTLGLPVVATAFSGNMDFMTADDSCLVGFDLAPVVATTQPAYAAENAGAQMWAEPRLDEAAQWMVRLANDPAWRRDLGSRARIAAAAASERSRPDALIAETRRLGDSRSGDTSDAQRRLRSIARGFILRTIRRKASGAIRRIRKTLASQPILP